MRRTLALGWGMSGVLAAAPAFAQFAADRAPAPVPSSAPTPTAAQAPMTDPAVQPASAFAPPSGSAPVVRAMETPVASAAEAPPHPWAVKPEHGGWFVCVKAYSGPMARAHAEELAAEIRQTHRAAAYLFERGAEDRKKEEQKREAIRKFQREQNAPFLDLREQMRAKAAAEGREFDDAPVKIRVPKIEYPEQWAVIVGGFPDMDAAAKARDVIRQWAAPKGKEHLLDRAVISGGANAEGAYLNPYTAALVVPNPSVRRDDTGPKVDPLLAKLNENEELSLLKCTKPVTLLVKSFSVPTRTVTKDADASIINKLFGAKPGSMLDATAQQAQALAKALRHHDFYPHPFESYVLHVRTGSLVCVGQFDSIDDPELQRLQAELSAITFQVKEASGRQLGNEKMFDKVFPMAIPKVQ